MKVKKITTIGILCALAMIVNLFAFMPLVPTVTWLTYDPKDIIIVIGGFIYGPMTSLIISYRTSHHKSSMLEYPSGIRLQFLSSLIYIKIKK